MAAAKGEAEEQSASTKSRRLRRFVFRSAAGLFAALCLLGLVEVAARIFFEPPAVAQGDPYVSFAELAPLFVLDETGSHYETNGERLAAFRPQSFAARKRESTFRIFCLGGSTVQGRPYSVETSFTTWLALGLRAAEPERNFEVINCGGISYASYRLVPIVAELLEREPDLFIIYTGHNEFLEERTYGHLKAMPRWLSSIQRQLLELRSYALVHELVANRRGAESDGEAPSPTVMADAVETRLDAPQGLASYHRDDAGREATIEHFFRNVETMARTARRAGVGVILINPVSNLGHCAPFKSEAAPGLGAHVAERVDELRHRARALDRADTFGKIELLEQAVALDGRHAGLAYQLGGCYARLGRLAEAKKWFERARDEDVCPLRIIEPMHEAILSVADEHDVPLVDLRALFEAHSDGGIPGDEWLLDHVHPTIAGHRLIADELLRKLVDMKIIAPRPGWTSARDALWKEHFSTLDDAYHARGAARLERLREWSRGTIPR